MRIEADLLLEEVLVVDSVVGGGALISLGVTRQELRRPGITLLVPEAFLVLSPCRSRSAARDRSLDTLSLAAAVAAAALAFDFVDAALPALGVTDSTEGGTDGVLLDWLLELLLLLVVVLDASGCGECSLLEAAAALSAERVVPADTAALPTAAAAVLLLAGSLAVAVAAAASFRLICFLELASLLEEDTEDFLRPFVCSRVESSL